MRSLFCFIIIFCATFSLRVNAQRAKVDSLVRKLRTELHDSVRVKVLGDIAYKLMYNDPDSSIKLTEQALELTKKLPESGTLKDRHLAINLTNMGIGNALQGRLQESKEFFEKSLVYWEKLDNKSKIASTQSNIGNVFSLQGNYSEALVHYYKALKLHQVTKDSAQIAICLQNIGIIFFNQKDYNKSLDHFYRSLVIKEKLKEKRGLSNLIDNIGNVYQDQAVLPNTSEREKRDLFNRSLKMHLRALDIARDRGETMAINSSLGNIANLYRQLEDYPKALENYTKAIEFSEKVGDKQSESLFLTNLGGMYTHMKDYKKAETVLLRALAIDTALGIRSNLMGSHDYLHVLYSKIGKHQLALHHYKEYISIRDSIFSEEGKKKSIKAELDFEFAKKEAVAKEAAAAAALIAKTESKRQRIVIAAVAFILLLTIIFALFLYNRFKLTQKQKGIIEEQKHLVEEKHKEITDSINYAERIQRSLLASDELLRASLKDHFIFFKPKDVVSGDFYWARTLSNGRFALLTADSTGHGVPGAIMSILNVSCLEKAVEAERLLEPAQILDHTRAKVIETLKKDGSKEGGKDGMDCSLISLDLKNNSLTYAAANNPIWIIRQKQLMEFMPDKMPVGKHELDTRSFTQTIVELKQDDCVYTLTDGMADQFGGPKGKKFMYKKLKELLIATCELPMKEQKELLSAALSEWMGALEQVDDITIVGIRI